MDLKYNGIIMGKALFISSRPIYPIKGGDQIRTAQQLDLLCKYFNVDVLYISPDSDDYDIKSMNSSISKSYRFQIGRIRSIINTLRFIFNNLPLQVNYYYDKSISKLIDSVINDYDVAFCNNIRTAEYVRKHHIIKYIDFVDAISMNYEKARKNASGIKRLIYSIDYHRCRKYEQKCLSAFDSCAVISDVDKQYILKCTN